LLLQVFGSKAEKVSVAMIFYLLEEDVMLFKKGVVVLALAFATTGCVVGHHAAKKAMGNGVKITKPATMAKVRGPVEVCMSTSGYTVEPAKNGVNTGKGHHHLLIDVYNINVNRPIAKDANHVHMGDGSTCKTLELSSGQHTITAVFAKGNHVPYNPPVTDAIVVFVGDSN
jgi:hypothetical protein